MLTVFKITEYALATGLLIRIVSPDKTRGYPYPVRKKTFTFMTRQHQRGRK